MNCITRIFGATLVFLRNLSNLTSFPILPIFPYISIIIQTFFSRLPHSTYPSISYIQINNCYPPEVVEYYSPNYSKTLLQKIDEYQPAM